MKRIAFVFTVLFVAGVAVYSAVAQPPGGGPGPGGQRGGRGQGGPDGFRPPPHPLEEALDTDGDHQLSAEELENAVASLKKLDKNEDGKLSDDELRPRFGGRPGDRDGAGRGAGAPGGRDGAGRPEGRGRGPDAGPGGRGPDGPPNPEMMIEMAMRFDADGDGKLSREELTKFAHDMARRRGGEGNPQGRGPEGGGRPQRPAGE